MTDKPQNDGNQAQNAAILLKVAQTMAKLGVAAFPRNYELFYEALSGSHPQLTRDVAALGAHPAQNQIEQIGIKYHLSGFAAIEADTIRADTARSISAVSHVLKDSIAKKEVFAAKFGQNAAMITITDISARIAGRLLLDHASVSLPAGTKAGLVGATVLANPRCFASSPATWAETGSVSIPKNARIGQVAQEAPGTEDAVDRDRAQGRQGARGAARGSRNRHRSAPHRRYPDAPCRYRGAFRRIARRQHSCRPRLRSGGAVAPGLVLLRRLAHARGAGGRAVFRARPAAARRADQLSRP
jgi:hypothetical protein